MNLKQRVFDRPGHKLHIFRFYENVFLLFFNQIKILFTCGCRVMGVNHPGPIPRSILWLGLVKFKPNELVSSLGLAPEPWEVLKVIHNVTCLNLLLKNVLLVEEKNEGRVVEPVLKLNLSEQLDRLFQSVDRLTILSHQVGVILINSRQEDYTSHTLLKIESFYFIFLNIKYSYREKVNPIFSLRSLAPNIRYFEITIADNKLIFCS